MGLLDTQCVLTIFVNLSLVVIIVNLRELLSIASWWVNLLHYVLLLYWNTIFQINNVILVLQVIKFVIKAFDYVVGNDVISVWNGLIATLFCVWVKIPREDGDDVLVIVFVHDLNPVFNICFN